MPMENTGKTYGEEEFVLMTDMDSETIERRVKNSFIQIPTAIGLNNHQGSKASADQHVMSNVARVLKEKKLFFIDSRTTGETIAETTMEVFGVPTARRNVFLDNEDYSSHTIDADQVGDMAKYISEGLDGVFVQIIDDKPIGIQLPASVVLEVVDTPPELKGGSATKRSKPAILSTGIEIQVPEYIVNGEKITVSTTTGEFGGRA